MNQRMYDRVAALVSIVLLAMLAGGTWYVAEITNRQQGGPAGDPKAHVADYFVEHVALVRLNNQGNPIYRVQAQRLDHFPDDDTTEFVSPTLVSLDPEKPLVTIVAKRGQSTAQGLETRLYDNVVLTRAGYDDHPPMKVETDYVLLLSEDDIATTDHPVRITYGESVLTGVGMEFNNGSRQLDVKSQVKGRWTIPPKNKG